MRGSSQVSKDALSSLVVRPPPGYVHMLCKPLKVFYKGLVYSGH